MHELSIALEICRIAQAHAGAAGAARVVTVGVEVGDDAGIEPEHLTFCLETLLASPPFAGARPVIERSSGDMLRVGYVEIDA